MSRPMPCRYCGNKVTWDALAERFAEVGTQHLNTTAEESSDMAAQCGLSEDGRHRPRRPNVNPVLDMARDSFDGHDPWGSATGWAGACADVLCDADANMVPASLGYRPSMAGPEVPNGSAEPHRITLADLSYETVAVWCWLHDIEDADNAPDPEDLPYWEDPTFRARAGELQQACILWSRYLDWCKSAGRDY